MKNGSTALLTTTYAFKTVNSKATGQVGTMRNLATGYDVSYTYEYDGNGNILSVSDGTHTTTYQYDQSNQLVRENNQKGGYTYTWVYDRAGNILSRTEYAYTTGTLGTPTETVTYTYGNSAWGDQLTAMGDRAFTYDQIGNVLNDGQRTYTWEHGRQLATLTQNGATWTNTYDVNGLRMKRTDGTNTYQYYYVGGDLISMTYNGSKLYFSYTPDGLPYGVEYGGAQYVYVLNLQGDVVAILDASGAKVAEYTYDAWGNILSVTGSMADTLGQINPLRYRSYVYDRETGLYYLQTRYYDPEIGRFINADGLVSTGQGILGNNMYAYCGNNPICRSDYGGTRYCEGTTIAGNRVSSRSLPTKGEPNSSQVLHNPDGTIKQKRWYGPDGNPERDRDNNHPGDGPFPHDHEWKDGKRGKDHLPPSSEYEFSWDPIVGIGVVTVCTIGIAVVMLDDATGVGFGDDFLLGPLSAGVGKGLALIF